MQETRYIYAIVNIGNEAWFKKEVQFKKWPWKFSFSTSGYLTFKYEGNLSEKELLLELQNMDPSFARAIGVFQNKASAPHEQNIDEAVGMIFESFEVKPGEFWIGKRLPRPGVIDRNQVFAIAGDKGDGPSRTFHKAREAVELLGLPLKSFPTILELGSAPGGTSLYFLESGTEVIGVDAAEMDQQCLKHPKFRHIKKPIQSVTREDLGQALKRIEFVSVDMNLMPSRSLKESLRLVPWLPSLKHFMITLKTSRVEDIEYLQRYRTTLKKQGFLKTRYFQLPSHRHETLLYATDFKRDRA